MIGTYRGSARRRRIGHARSKDRAQTTAVFLQDGDQDLNIYAGDWWMANQTMNRALEWAGYEVEHVWGAGRPQPQSRRGDLSAGHAVALAGLSAARAHSSGPLIEPGREMLVDGADWELIGEGYQWAEGLAVTADGTLYFSDVPASKIYRVPPGGKPELFVEDSGKANGLALGPDGRLYGACSGVKKILAWDLDTAQAEAIAEGFASNDLVVLHNGSIYVTDPQSKQVWHIDPATHQAQPVDRFEGCNGITVSPDQTLLYVAHFPGRFIYSYQIAADGRLNYKQPYFHLHLPPFGTESHADGMCTSAEGWLLSATESGIQICDQPGRVNLILPKPGSGPPGLLRAIAREHPLRGHRRCRLEAVRSNDRSQTL